MRQNQEVNEFCAKAYEQVFQEWEALMDDVEFQDITQRLHAIETSLSGLQTSLKSSPPLEKISKATELKALQQQVAKLHTKTQRRIDRVMELKAEAGKVTVTIHPVHVEVKQVLDATMVDVS